MKNQSLKSSPLSSEAISHQLELMLANPDFTATPQQSALLKYVVSQTLAGHADNIKGYTVATEVFGRGSDFDQSIDPIVSIQASRLRRAIALYYETTGKSDPIRINIPKGTYVPTFDKQSPHDQPLAAEPAAAVDVMSTWPTLLVRKLANLTDNADDNYLAIGLTAELYHALSHFREIRVCEALHRDAASTPRDKDVDFILDGSIRRDAAGIQVAVTLCDAKKCLRIWSGKYQGELEAAKMIALQENVAAEVAVRVAGDNAIITRHLTDLFRRKEAPEMTTYEAMLRFWEADTLLTPKSVSHAIRTLEHAVAHEPDYGQIWSMLAAQYANNYGLKIVDLPTPIEKAAAFAHKGVGLDPTNRRARMILAYVRLMENKLSEARYEAEIAYQLCPESLMVLDALGWVMALAGGWERGVNWVEKAVQLNPYYRPWVRHVLGIRWFWEQNYENAYRETLRFTMPDCHWDQILRASACGHLGKIEEGQACIRKLLAIKPDFTQRGRILNGRYVKFEDIVDRIITGLYVVGLSVD